MVTVTNVRFSARTQLCCAVTVLVLAAAAEVAALSGPNVCMVKQKYNITMRVKYRAPLSVRTYEWCMALPPRCSRWRTEVRDLTRLETEERTAEVAVCCPGYKMRDVSCVPICPSGRTGPGCSQECPPLKWGPNCVNECGPCEHGTCSPVSGDCSCQHGWQGESCESRMSSSTSSTTTAGVEELLTKITATKTTQSPSAISSTTAFVETTLISATTIPTTAFTTTTVTTTATSPTTVKQSSSVTTTKLPQEFNTTLRISTDETNYSSKKQETIDSQKISTTNTTRITTAKPTTITTPVMTTLATTVMSNTEVKTGVTPSTETIKIVETTTKPNITFDKVEQISKINVTPKTRIHKENAHDKFTTVRVITTESSSPTVTFGNTSLTRDSFNSKTHTAPNFNVIYNKKEPTQTTKVQAKEVHVEIKTTPVRILKTNNISKTTVPTVQKTTAISVFTETPILTTHATTITEGGTKVETTRRPDATIRYFPTTVKFKPKEIWIRPAQKEPEHITAVMEGKEKQRTSVDLISVISIAGGIMMAVITVAVIIVMIERCKRPRYEDVRKMNDIHMQVMIDNHEVPPPYVRSIFHTPLPDPPSSDKCHYQPISTLDRNLKQFMRPVVVQTISPIMLENFRGILECHYDHLPRRSHDFEVKPKHCSVSPSSEDADELSRLRPCSIAELTIDATQCEAKLDVLDSTTSEPLYAEIPCWRPPSEHAIEVMNYNGEAVTEL